MAIIPQKKLFTWTEIQPLGDLKRLQLVLDYMPDEDLVRTLEKKRGQGRGYSVTKAAEFDVIKGRRMLKQLAENQPEIMEKAETLAADKAYDDTKLIVACWDDYRIKPVIDIRNTWKDEDKTRLLADKKNVVYNYKGNVFCYCPVIMDDHAFHHR